MMSRIPRELALVALLGLAGACASPIEYDLLVNGYLEGESGTLLETSGSFHVAADEKAPNPLLERELARKIGNRIEEAGFSIAPEGEADWVVRFAYGSSSELIHRTEYVPDHFGTGLYHRGWFLGGFHATGDFITRSETEYAHHLTLKVVKGDAYRKGDPEVVIWVGEARARTGQPDLRRALDFLLRGLFSVFARDTGRGIRFTLVEEPTEEETESP